VPVKWLDGWPILGGGKVSMVLDLPMNTRPDFGIVGSDDFKRKKGDRPFPLFWQWNHNPDDAHWSLTDRKGFLRITPGRVDTSFYFVKNMLTQRTYGPTCAGSTKIDVSNMKEGDFAGLALFQKRYGQVGVKISSGSRYILMTSAESGKQLEVERIPLSQSFIYFKAECDFRDMQDLGYFYYSLDGKSWKAIGTPIKMVYTLPHFMGYRFGLFNYATKEVGGYVDFDFFHVDHAKISGH
jgi:beta-xylosidase